MERLANLAIDLVITRDKFHGSIEGLECIMIESMYQANIGSLRRSWVSNRRAMGIAQLMCLHRSDHRTQFEVLDPNTRCHPQLMWFRIVFLDRQLSLLLGLSQGSLDRSMASDVLLQTDTPMGRLERIHCVISSKILERNALSSHSTPHDYSMMKPLDLELQKAAMGLPSKWWLVPTLNAGLTDSQALFWDTRRLFAQVLHYNLVNHLHLPYMLRSSSAGRKYEFSRITCVNASREVLSRFITLRRFNKIAYSCRTIDFLALMAAMTLLLAHLDSHSEAENLLAHQYLSDRAMIEQAQENMQEVNSLNSDAMSAQSAELLRRLLAIGSGPLDGSGRISVQGLTTETVPTDQSDDDVVTVNIPYFGIVKIAGGDARKEAPRNQYPQQRTDLTYNRLPQFQSLNMPCKTRPENSHTADPLRHGGVVEPHEMPNAEVIKPPVDARCDRLEMSSMSPNPLTATGTYGSVSNSVPQINTLFSDSFFQNPGLTAGGQDWAFQGVDMAFFDNLINNVLDSVISRGLGRSLAMELIASGCRHLAFIPRSGDTKPGAKAIVEELSETVAQIKVFRGDISEEASFLNAIQRCSQQLPPIQGVVQMAMVLRYAIFEKMTHDEWTASLRPKVQRT
ncbi:Polyketide synthase, KR [Penicillium expansum]|uniref:Polyketide synthase, KR n=1 Tax=Penicillium expansum TaxID=27334 RepID=A0A0A2K5F4_PENEN|nr:Polyketide synthase, KR [Penicillium expansum]KGO63027.1 Polyketide synthase, KR [Penicillium expansum]